ncbi:DUF2442 domain-containing protein [Almyronema epifaneia]|uniref:DUF2442 domain-containing protein n=1 Tax=Almyronema epifaneia S1 TaxID=2991925 RepID=A0ABW6ICA9_9CYAN
MTNRDLASSELEEQIQKAREETELDESLALVAKKAFYNEENKLIIIELANDVIFSFPTRLIQGLDKASKEQLVAIEISPSGQGLHWEELDIDLDIPNLLSGIFGTKSWMRDLGRKGGKSRSQAKISASRENGKKGGRPRKNKASEIETRSVSDAEIDSAYQDFLSDGLEY